MFGLTSSREPSIFRGSTWFTCFLGSVAALDGAADSTMGRFVVEKIVRVSMMVMLSMLVWASYLFFLSRKIFKSKEGIDYALWQLPLMEIIQAQALAMDSKSPGARGK